jgi:ferric-dicitrate binding protein FerR (iron transport regulator)
MTQENERSATVTALDTADPVGKLIARAGRRQPAPPAIEASVRAAVHAAWREETAKRSRWRRLSLAAAAAIAALAAGVSWQFVQRTEPPSRPAVARLDQTLGTVSVKSPDGTLRAVSTAGTEILAEDGLWTASDSGARLHIGDMLELRVAPSSRIAMLDAGRIRLEAGALFVDSDGVASALTIETPLGEVTHIGTRYQVRVEPDATTVLVRNGRVRVSTPSSTLTADGREKLVLTGAGRIDRSSVAAYGGSWGWVDSLAESIEIDGLTMARFLEWVADETGRELAFADGASADSAASTVLHGSIDGLSPDEALQAVLATTDLSAQFEGARLIVAGRGPD